MPVFQEIDRAEVQRAYDQGQFLEAYELTKPIWDLREIPKGTPIDDVVLAARLSHRLGAVALSGVIRRWLHASAPNDPRAQYWGNPRGESTFDAMARIWSQRTVESVDPILLASWHGQAAALTARMRDFELADWHIEQAREQQVERAWVDACEAEVRLHQERYDESLRLARKSIKGPEVSSSAAFALLQVAPHHNLLSEVVDELEAAIGTTWQSWEVSGMLVGMNLKLAGMPGEDREKRLHNARKRAEEIVTFAPLADRRLKLTQKYEFAAIAIEAHDRDGIREACEDSASRYYRRLAKAVEAAPIDATTKLLDHEVVYQRYNTCMPASAAMVLGVLGERVDQDTLASAVEFGGTASWRLREWAEEQGYAAHHFVATPEVAHELISAGLPFVLALTSEDSGHAMAAVGYDELLNVLIVRDPTTGSLMKIPLDWHQPYDAPVGPQGLLLLPEGHTLPDGIVLPETEVLRIFEAVNSAISQRRYDEVRELRRKLREHPNKSDAWRYTTAIMDAYLGNVGAALKPLEELFKTTPQSFCVQRSLFHTLELMGDTRRLQAALHRAVFELSLRNGKHEQLPVAAVLSATYQLALMLSQRPETFDRGLRLIRNALEDAQTSGTLLSAMGDLLSLRDPDDPRIEFSLRVAALLEYANSSLVEGYAGYLAQRGRRDEALAFLKDRYDNHAAHDLSGAECAVTYLRGLEFFAAPEDAITFSRICQERFPQESNLQLLTFMTFFRLGRDKDAERSKQLVKDSENEDLLLRVELEEARLSAEHQSQLEASKKLVQLHPDDMDLVADLVSSTYSIRGPKAALKLVRKLRERAPDNDRLEMQELNVLQALETPKELRGKVLDRLKRLPADIATRALFLNLEIDRLYLLPQGSESQQLLKKLKQESGKLLESAPAFTTAYQIAADLETLDGKVRSGIDLMERALERVDETEPILSNLMSALYEMPPQERQACADKIARLTRENANFLDTAPLSIEVVSMLGSPEQGAELAKDIYKRYPGVPEVLAARASSLLVAGHDQEVIKRARKVMEREIHRWPTRGALQATYLDVLRHLGDFEALGKHLDWWVSWQPHDPWPLHQRSQEERRRGNNDKALADGYAALERAPLSNDALLNLINIYFIDEQPEEALKLLRKMRERFPLNPMLWSVEVNLLDKLMRGPEALSACRHFTATMPDEGSAWQQQASLLQRYAAQTSKAEVIAAIDRAIQKAPRSEELVFDKVDILLGFGDKEGARQALQSPALGAFRPLTVALKQIIVDAPQRLDESVLARLRQLLDKHPHFLVGWQTLMGWVRDLNDAGLALSYLQDVPTQFTADEEFHGMRLAVLRMAGLDHEQLYQAYESAIKAIPASHSLLLDFGDALLDDPQFGTLSERVSWVLQELIKRAPSAPPTVGLRCRIGLKQRAPYAIELLREVISRKEAVWTDVVAECTMTACDSDVQTVSDWFLDPQTPPDTWAPAAWRGFVFALRQANDLRRLTQCLDKLSPVVLAEGYRDIAVSVLSGIVDCRDARYALKWFEARTDLASLPNDLWQAYPLALLAAGKERKAIKVVRDRGDLTGFSPWGYSNFVSACLDKGKYAEGYEFGVRALDSVVPGDGYASLVEGTLYCAFLMKRFGELVQLVERFGDALVELEESPIAIAMIAIYQMYRAQSAQEAKEAERLLWSTGIQSNPNLAKLMRKAHWQFSTGKLSWLSRVWRQCH